MAKKPTGNRPTPKVAQSKAAKGAGKMNKSTPAVKHTSMASPKAAATRSDTSKRRGF
jgi:hypothetical protein